MYNSTAVVFHNHHTFYVHVIISVATTCTTHDPVPEYLATSCLLVDKPSDVWLSDCLNPDHLSAIPMIGKNMFYRAHAVIIIITYHRANISCEDIVTRVCNICLFYAVFLYALLPAKRFKFKLVSKFIVKS